MVNSLDRVGLFHTVWLIVWVVTLSHCVVNSLGRVGLFHTVWLIVWVV